MSTALPQSMSMEMLSRLPPQSFELEYREIRPDIESNGGVYRVDQDSKVTFHIRSATNEVMLNTNVYLCGQVASTLDYTGNGNPTLPAQTPANGTAYRTALAAALGPNVAQEGSRPRWRRGPTWIKSSRESFNSGSLPFLDNQNTGIHLAVNNNRCQAAKRESRLGGIGDGLRSSKVEIKDLHGAGWSDDNSQYDGLNAVWKHFDVSLQNRVYLAPVKKFAIPLGMYSNLVNTPSVIPSGLLSAYSVNGHSVEVTLANLVAQSARDRSIQHVNVANRLGLAPASDFMQTFSVAQSDANGDGYRNLRIYAPFVKILDPAVMEGLLSLYEKREVVQVGSSSFPMSLRLNSLGQRYFNFALDAAQGDYYWRLPSTDRSVRAVAWYLFNTARPEREMTSLSGGDQLVSNDACPINTRMETRIGSQRPHPVVEDQQPGDRNIPQFYALNKRRSAHCFSPFPYYQESIKHDGHQSDIDYTALWADASNAHQNVQSGVISLENLDYREPDYSGSFQASGFDLTNVGGIDINMRFNHLADAGNSAGVDQLSRPRPAFLSGPGPALAGGSWNIVFVLAYDSIHESSPSGVSDITASVL